MAKFTGFNGLVWIVILYSLLYNQSMAYYMVDGVQEICSSETYTSRCRSGELVVMETAIYGRMRLGRCVQKNMGQLGCRTDVLDIADSLCSGLPKCEIRVPDTEMDDVMSCDKELSRYLEADHTCVKAISIDTTQCVNPITISVGAGTNHIPSTVSEVSGCGRHMAPWILEASPGQTINLTLLDFSWTIPNTKNHNNHHMRGPWETDTDTDDCPSVQYGYMQDLSQANHRLEKICGGGERISHLFISQGNRVSIVLQEKALLNRRFIIRFSAVGCPDLVEPKHAWTERTEDTLVVGCKATRQTWHLKCVDNRWEGVIGNCTHYLPHTPSTSGVMKEEGIIHNVIAILVIIGVAAVISCSIIVVGIWCYKRFSKQHKDMQREYQCATLNTNKSDLYIIKDEMDDSKSYGYPDQIYPFGTNEYTHIWGQQQTHGHIPHEKDDLKSEVPTQDAPLLPQQRATFNNNVVGTGSRDVTAPRVQAVPDTSALEEIVYKPSVSEPTVNNLPPSKYLLLDKVK